jgi:chorismate mutase/prephenate dehydrogenase
MVEIDRQILGLVKRRLDLAREIGKQKAREGFPTRDFSQEKVVIQRAAADAAQFGVSPDLAENLTLLLIDASLTVQEKARVSDHAGGGGRRVLVIGGAGRMGRWMVRFLSSQDFEVEVADPAGPVEGFSHIEDWRESSMDHHIVVVAPTLRVSRDILQEMAKAPPRGLVFDIGSLKTPLRPALLALAEAGAKVTSVHPMFGPDTDLLSGRHVVFVDLGVPEATREARELFAPTMAVQVEMDLESHDRLIAYVLGLSHALNLAFTTVLAESGEHAERLAKLSSTTFDAQVALAGAVAHDNPHLYFELQSLNEYGSDSLDALARAVGRIQEIVRTEDEVEFVKLMTAGMRYFEGRATPR